MNYRPDGLRRFVRPLGRGLRGDRNRSDKAKLVTGSFLTINDVIFAYTVVILMIDLLAVTLVNVVIAQEERNVLSRKATVDCSGTNVPLGL
jgi:hypothetical protein